MKNIVTYLFILFISSTIADEGKNVFGSLESASDSGNRIALEILVRNNSDSTIYLDSNLLPYVYQILKRIETVDDDGFPDVGIKVYAGEGRAKDQRIFLTSNWMVEIKPGQNHLFKISKKHKFDLRDATAKIQFKFDYYVKNDRTIRTIAVSSDLACPKK